MSRGCVTVSLVLLLAITTVAPSTLTEEFLSSSGGSGDLASSRGSRQRREGAALFLPSSYIILDGEGTGWGEWGQISPCSRTCGGGVASQKRKCLQLSSDGQPQCTGGDTKYFMCATQDCPESAQDFRAQQCSKYNNQTFKGNKYIWEPYTNAPNPCELNCMPVGGRFYTSLQTAVVDGTRCNDESYDVCVQGTCQPVGCDMMLGSNAKEDKCQTCRGNGLDCYTTKGLIDRQDLLKGYNNILVIPEGATNIEIAEIKPSINYLALRSMNESKYYLNGDNHIEFPHKLEIAGTLWHYERDQQGPSAPDKLRCLGPTTEPLIISLLLQDVNVGIDYEYSILDENRSPHPTPEYDWVHDEFTPCSASCGEGIQRRNVMCMSRQKNLKQVNDQLCDKALRPVSIETCNLQECPAQWIEGPWSACSKPCGEGATKSRKVYCQKIITNGFPSVVADKECFDTLGSKPALFQECNQNATCPTWFTGTWTPCDKLCDEGKQTRQVVCTLVVDGKVTVFDECLDEKPPAEQSCMVQPCRGVDWLIGEWTGCDTCLTKTRTRQAVCMTDDKVIVNSSFCQKHKLPILEEPCDRNKQPPCQAQWYATQWSPCSVKCGNGTAARRVFCGIFDGRIVTQVHESKCANLTKYNDTKTCEIPLDQCPAQWVAGPWFPCDKECGGGKQIRYVVCLQNGKIADGNICARENLNLDVWQSCNNHSCDHDIPNLPTQHYGYCPNNTAALGPFDQGCFKPRTCIESKYGCCPDKLSPALGPADEGCPVPACSDTLFGCCSSDNQTAAEGNDQEGCPLLPPPCLKSKYGCCKDGETEATGAEKAGCPESSTSIIAPTGIEESGHNAGGLPCNSTEIGCSPDSVTPAPGLSSNEYVVTCNVSTHGCCEDETTPAHGPDGFGCCLLSPYGCCPDNYESAEGPNLEGCECQSTEFGCCPDKATIAQGSNNEGCGCQYSQHGCCPDRHTEASGPKFEGCDCETYQFGCCLDGVTFATGPNLQGCHCRDSKYGCCGDGETAAVAPAQGGCDCSSSMYGCCPDGITDAKGPKFHGCAYLPENKYEVCSLPADRGSGDDYSMYWYYDITYGSCLHFWYAGYGGNGNRFENKEDCENACIQPPGKDACKLPKVKGVCVGNTINWYYDSLNEQCSQFNYGGCHGNMNNFASKEQCQSKCEPERSVNQCDLPIERGPCTGNFSRWSFNSEKQRCEKFIWGGCKGNSNRFNSETACMMRCNPPKTSKMRCTEPQLAGNCTEIQALWSFSQTENRCVPFYYTGCMGNDNRFDSLESCTKACPSAYEPNECTLPATTGECTNYRTKWFYDTTEKMCREFYYGGCGGNSNNFDSQEMCEYRCAEP